MIPSDSAFVLQRDALLHTLSAALSAVLSVGMKDGVFEGIYSEPEIMLDTAV